MQVTQQVTQLWSYPIKSCAGVSLSEAVLDERGVQDDRRWMLVDERGSLVSLRDLPTLINVQPALTPTELIISAPGMSTLALERSATGESRRVTVWDDTMDALELPAASAWFQEYTGRAVTLVYLPDSSERPMNPRFGSRHLSFVDGNPLHLVCDSSVRDLSRRIGTFVDVRRFRPNIVVGGGDAYAEDTWREVLIGQMPFSVYEACQRCAVVSISPDDAAQSKQPLAELARYRRVGRHVVFGVNLSHQHTGTLHVGTKLSPSS